MIQNLSAVRSESIRVTKVDCEANFEKAMMEKLCDYVLLNIFSNLSARDLKNASLVCKNWNKVIGSSSVTMNNFILKLKFAIPFKEVDKSFRSNRMHQMIKLEMDYYNSDVLTYFNISKVKKFEYQCVHYNGLSQMLTQMPMLESLAISLGFSDDNIEGPEVNLPMLRQLAINVINFNVLGLIVANNVTDISFKNDTNKDFLNGEYMTRFLNRCKNVTAFRTDSRFGTEIWNNCDLKLSTFEFDFVNECTETYKEKLCTFLMFQAQTLTNLQLNDYYWNDLRHFLEKTLSHLPTLVSLSLYYFDLWEDDLSHLTELKNLTIFSRCYDINRIAKFNQKLTYLNVRIIGEPLKEHLRFNNLKHLVTRYIGDQENWLSVIKNSPNIETVELIKRDEDDVFTKSDEDDEECVDTINVLLERPALKNLQFQIYRKKHIEQIFEKLNTNHGNLKSLRLCRKEWSDKSAEFLFGHEWNAEKRKKMFDEAFTKSNSNVELNELFRI